MVIRIVKLTFQESKIDEFLTFFDRIKEQVNSFPGCKGVMLLRDMENPCLVMTYSHWDHPEDLESYRTSEIFSKIWPTIKPWFAEKPEAWSVEAYFNGFVN